MNDYKQIIKRLEKQKITPNTTVSQRDANTFRMKWLEMLNREKTLRTETIFYDTVQ
ncbi:hypothetical protein ACFW1J_01480 [Priestia aryabhattai]|uniref:hypothetical protein n=1 Tax=Priestia aryabhattai TaxID=412384 RepID=UPI00366F397A